MSKVTIDEVKRIAALSRIGITPDEASAMSVELSSIVGFVEQLSAVDTTGVEPTSQVTGLVDVWRLDEIRPRSEDLSQADLLMNAPATHDGYIQVRRVMQ
jgi:aspartyl-tRNA(Asn)/glutamyl-tRNA(Gln) amidotransferase subunit C